MYAFATLKDHKLTEANDDDPENYDKLIEMRDSNPDLQVSLELDDYWQAKYSAAIL